jgi:ABC-type sulfate transport system permease subunit
MIEMINDPSRTAALAGGFAIMGIFVLVALLFGVIVQWRIASKAGYPGAYSLLMLIPLVNVVVLILFAFTEWPIERRLAAGGGPLHPPQPHPASYIPPGGGGYAPQAIAPAPVSYTSPVQQAPYGVAPPPPLPDHDAS